MKIVGRLLAVVTIAVSLSACVTPSMLYPPTELATSSISLGNPASHTELVSHVVQPLNDSGSMIYQQEYGGGGVGLGLLGPFGVAANIAMIESKTKEEVAGLKGHVEISPENTFQAAVSATQFPLAAAAGDATIVPFVRLVKQENGDLMVGAELVFSTKVKNKPWLGRYVYQLDETIKASDAAAGLSEAAIAGLQSKIDAGYQYLLTMHKSDFGDRAKQPKKVIVTSKYVSARFELGYYGEEIRTDAARVDVRTPFAVMSLPTDAVKITPR